MKKLAKTISIMLALAMLLTVITPFQAFAKTKYVVASEKLYYATYNEVTEKSELVLSVEYKHTYNKKGLMTKQERVAHFGAEKQKSTTKFAYDKKNRRVKMTYSDGTYTKITYNKKGFVATEKKYNKKNKVISSLIYSFNKKGQPTKWIEKSGKDKESEGTTYPNGIHKSSKYYEENKLYNEYKYDKHGYVVEHKMYDYSSGKKKLYVHEKMTIAYEKDMRKKVTLITEFHIGDEIQKDKNVTNYYTSGVKAGFEKDSISYNYNNALKKYDAGVKCTYKYKFDKTKKNIIEQTQVNIETKEVYTKHEMTWKKINY